MLTHKLTTLCLICTSILLATKVSAQFNQPDLILLSVDTLRADYLGCYGSPTVTTPTIDYLSRQGLLFTNVVTTIGKTAPAFSSLFTSHYPPTTGLRRNGMRICDSLPTLAEIVRSAGYQTAAVISNWTLRHELSGLGRGFSDYFESMPEIRQGPLAREKSAALVTRETLAFLKTTTQTPLFLWIHYSDPHDPYQLHPYHLLHYPSDPIREDGMRKKKRYSSEVGYCDYWIGQMLLSLKHYRHDRPLYLFFCSDHGESLGEHHYWGHGKNVMQPNLAIPLIVLDQHTNSNSISTVPGTILDIMPTMIQIANLPSPIQTAGTNILTLAQSPRVMPRDRFCFADKGLKLFFHQARKQYDPLALCLIRDRWKLIWINHQDSWQLFDLENDPIETKPLSIPSYRPDIPTKTELELWYEKLPVFTIHNDLELTSEDIQQLKSLGYVE
ncbi:sulfatase [bacterium]|nr:sulfatase [bacterium]